MYRPFQLNLTPEMKLYPACCWKDIFPFPLIHYTLSKAAYIILVFPVSNQLGPPCIHLSTHTGSERASERTQSSVGPNPGSCSSRHSACLNAGPSLPPSQTALYERNARQHRDCCDATHVPTLKYTGSRLYGPRFVQEKLTV